MTTSAHLAVVTSHATGLHHGALYVNHPTPSGSDRYLLSITTIEGYTTERSAAMAINASESIRAAYPGIELIDIESLPEGVDQPIDELIAMLPKSATVSVISPHKGDDCVEVRHEGISKKPLPITLTPKMVKKLELMGIVEFDCSSGHDPGLSAHYNHYRVV